MKRDSAGCIFLFPGRTKSPAVRGELRAAGFRLLEPADQAEALAVLPEVHPDLYLIEDGGTTINAQALRAIAHDGISAQLPVVVLAAADLGPGEARSLFQLGATDVSLAPHVPALVRYRIEALVDLKRRIDTARELSVRDELTGLYNRRFFLERLEQELARSQRSSDPLALLLFDVDCFKKVNDTFGHPVGDAVLLGVAAVARRNTRKSDLLARVGGDEFALLLGSNTLEGARVCAEGLRQRLRDARFDARHDLRVTVSVGIAAYAGPAAMPQPLADLVRAADDAMLRAKAAGRDCIVLADAALAAAAGRGLYSPHPGH